MSGIASFFFLNISVKLWSGEWALKCSTPVSLSLSVWFKACKEANTAAVSSGYIIRLNWDETSAHKPAQKKEKKKNISSLF